MFIADTDLTTGNKTEPLQWFIPIQDEDNWQTGFDLNKHTLVQDWVTRSPRVFPLRDLDINWTSADTGRDIIKLLMSGNKQPAGSHAGSHVPGFMLKEGWTNVTSDETLSRFMFAGMGINNVKPSQAGTAARKAVEEQGYRVPAAAAFVSDFAYMRLLDVRPGFENYGAIAFYDKQATLIEITWCGWKSANGGKSQHKDVRPGDKEWEHAKWAFKSTAFVAMTADDHLVKLHLISANYMTTAIRKKLPRTSIFCFCCRLCGNSRLLSLIL